MFGLSETVWLRLCDVPWQVAHAVVVVAPGGIWRERQAFVEFMARATQEYSSPELQQVIKQLQKASPLDPKLGHPDLALSEVSWALDTIQDPKTRRAFAHFVCELALKIAESAPEGGLLGLMRHAIHPSEAHFLQQLRGVAAAALDEQAP